MPNRADADAVIASIAIPIRAIRLIIISSGSHDCDVRHKPPVERLFRHLRSKIKNGILQPPFLFIPHRIQVGAFRTARAVDAVRGASLANIGKNWQGAASLVNGRSSEWLTWI